MTVRVLLEPPAAHVPLSRRNVRGLGWLRRALLGVGLAALAYSGYAYLEASVHQSYEEWSFERGIAGRNSPRTELESHGTGVAARANGNDPRGESTTDGSLIGRIDIPRLRVRAMVREGVDEGTLRRAVGHVPETVRPDTPGNVGLAGHRDSFFRRLKDVRKNDRVIVETLSGTYEYRVESLQVVSPQDVDVLAPSKESFLTLVTCYPFHYLGKAPRRYVVRARQVRAVASGGTDTFHPGS